MKALDRVWKRVIGTIHRKKRPVIRISRENPWKGDKLVRVFVPNKTKKFSR